MACLVSISVKRVLNVSNSTICTRRFVKPLIRTPIAVFSKKESEEFHKKNPKSAITLKPNCLTRVNLKRDGSAAYIFLKSGDERFGAYINKICKNSNENNKNVKIILEGARLISDAISAESDIKCIYFSRREDLTELPLDKLKPSTILYKVERKDMMCWSDSKCPSGLMAVANRPKDFRKYEPLLPVTVVLDGIEDEGHVGTLIRTAAAAGARKVFITSSTSDPWSQKALRAAMGGHFQIPIEKITSHLLEGHVHNTSSVYVIDSNHTTPTLVNQKKMEMSSTAKYDNIEFKENSLLFIGCGELQQLLKKSEVSVTYLTTLPNFDIIGPAINGSVVLYEMKRQFDTKLT